MISLTITLMSHLLRADKRKKMKVWKVGRTQQSRINQFQWILFLLQITDQEVDYLVCINNHLETNQALFSNSSINKNKDRKRIIHWVCKKINLLQISILKKLKNKMMLILSFLLKEQLQEDLYQNKKNQKNNLKK